MKLLLLSGINFSSFCRNFALIFLVLMMNGLAKAQLTLVDRGKSNYQIVLSKSAAEVQKKAATVLQNYLKEISSVYLPIVTDDQEKSKYEIRIGKTNRKFIKPQLTSDGFVIKSEGQQLTIYGNNDQATLYGTYHFLEKYLGCRKFTPTLKYIPKLTTIKLPTVNDLQNPQFTFRQVYYPGQYDEEFRAWHKLQLLEDIWGLWGHSFDKLVSPKVYFANHPEYFALVNGERKYTQLCLSNADVFEILVKELSKKIDEAPEKKIWSVSQNDGFGYCTCEACKATDKKYGGPQGSLLYFVNKVAKQFPNYTISTLAYLYSKHPPKNIKPEKNVSIMLSSIDIDRAKPIVNNPRTASFRNDVVGWSALTNQLMIWDYVVQFTNYLSPFPNLETLQPNANYFAANKVSGAFFQGTENTVGEFSALKAYLLAKLSWDPKADISKAQSEFMYAYYGKAAPFINQYINKTTEQLQQSKRVLDIYGDPVVEWNTWLKPDQIEQYSNILEKAAAAVETHPNFLKNVRIETLPLEFVVLQQARFYGLDKHGLFELQENNGWKLRPGMERKLDTFMELGREANILQLQEDGLTLENYGREWQEIMKSGPLLHDALGKEVTFLSTYSQEYPAKGAATLTDGTYGYLNYQYNYLGWFGTNMDVLIDLGESKLVDSVSAGFLEDQRHWAFLPSNISVELSNDKRTFVKAGEINTKSPEEHYDKVNHRPIIKINIDQPYRYVRIKAKNLTQLPIWRDLPNRKPWIFCDEIAVFEKK